MMTRHVLVLDGKAKKKKKIEKQTGHCLAMVVSIAPWTNPQRLLVPCIPYIVCLSAMPFLSPRSVESEQRRALECSVWSNERGTSHICEDICGQWGRRDHLGQGDAYEYLALSIYEYLQYCTRRQQSYCTYATIAQP